MGEFPGYIGIQADTSRAEKRLLSIYHTIINQLGSAIQYNLKGGFRIPADTQMQGQAIPAAARNNSKRFPAAKNSLSYFMDRPVSSNRDDNIRIGFSSQSGGISFGCRLTDYYVMDTICGDDVNKLENLLLRTSPSNRVDDEKEFAQLVKITKTVPSPATDYL